MTAVLQAHAGRDPRDNDLSAEERAAHEAFVIWEDDHRADEASLAPRCSCRHPCVDEGTCIWCGRRFA